MQAVKASSVPAQAPLEALGASYQAQARVPRLPMPQHIALLHSEPHPSIYGLAECWLRFLLPSVRCLLHGISAANAC